jgi:hypothetical protein
LYTFARPVISKVYKNPIDPDKISEELFPNRVQKLQKPSGETTDENELITK